MTETGSTSTMGTGSPLENVVPTVIQVLTDPRGFFTSMPREGGFEAPGMFAGIMLVAYGAVFGLFLLLHGFFGGFLYSVLFIPILGAIGLLIGAAIFLFLSRALGGEATFESSFRIVAYSGALLPVQAVAQIVPYLPILVSAYGIYIAIVAVISVHKVPEQKAWAVIGGIGAVLLLFSLSATIAARRVAPRLDTFSRDMQKSADDLGKASENFQRELGKTMERMGKGMEQQQQQLQQQRQQQSQKQQQENE